MAQLYLPGEGDQGPAEAIAAKTSGPEHHRTAHRRVKDENGMNMAALTAVLAPEFEKGMRGRRADMGGHRRNDHLARGGQLEACTAPPDHGRDFRLIG